MHAAAAGVDARDSKKQQYVRAFEVGGRRHVRALLEKRDQVAGRSIDACCPKPTSNYIFLSSMEIWVAEKPARARSSSIVVLKAPIKSSCSGLAFRFKPLHFGLERFFLPHHLTLT
jgi:hypothetical protein